MQCVCLLYEDFALWVVIVHDGTPDGVAPPLDLYSRGAVVEMETLGACAPLPW